MSIGSLPKAPNPSATCLLCDSGFPQRGGVHYGTQANGMIEDTDCRRFTTVFEQDGGGGGVRIERAGTTGGVHIYGHDLDDGEEKLVFSLGREDTAILGRALLRQAGVKQ